MINKPIISLFSVFFPTIKKGKRHTTIYCDLFFFIDTNLSPVLIILITRSIGIILITEYLNF